MANRAEPMLFAAMLVMLRIGGVLLGLPVLQSGAVPGVVRLFLLAALTIVAFMAAGAPSVTPPASTVSFVASAAREVLLGALIGFVARGILAAAEGAGALIDLSIGLGMARTYDPLTGGTSSSLEQLMGVAALGVFFSVNGHVLLLNGVVRSFKAFPLTGTGSSVDAASSLILSAGTVLSLALSLAAPVLLVGILMNAVLALAVRAAPGLNVFSVGLPAFTLVGLWALFVVMPEIGLQLASRFESLPSLIEGWTMGG